MGARLKPLPIGYRVERWEVIDDKHITRNKSTLWLCRCDCGTERPVLDYELRRSKSRSCGCLIVDVIRERSIKHGATVGIGQGERKLPEYKIWEGIKQRCNNPKDRAYRYYGGRGISIAPEWAKDFKAFLDHVGRRPYPDLEIDRIDNNGNYEPGNVRWTTRQGQMRNTRQTRNLTWNGKTKCLSEWAREVGLDHRIVWQRLKAGWTVDRALTNKDWRKCGIKSSCT